MPSISKGSVYRGPSSPWLTGGVVGLGIILALFFIPFPAGEEQEQSAASSSSFSGAEYLSKVFGERQDPGSATASQSGEVSSDDQSEGSPLARLLNSLGSPRASLRTESGSEVEKSSISKKSLRRARGSAKSFLKRLSPLNPQTTAAVNAYIAGINETLESGNSAGLEPLDTAVREAMAREGVHATLQKRWETISALSTQELPRPRIADDAPPGLFQPVLRLTNVWIRQGYKHHGRWDPNARVVVKIDGFIMGEGARKIEIYRNRDRIKKINVRKGLDEGERQSFRVKFRRDVKKTIFTFRVLDKFGRAYERSYNFYPRVRAFRWNGRTDGSFAIPFPENNIMMDRYFLVRASSISNGSRAEATVADANKRRGGSFETW